MHISVSIHLHLIYVSICMYVCMHVYMYLCMYVFMNAHVPTLPTYILLCLSFYLNSFAHLSVSIVSCLSVCLPLCFPSCNNHQTISMRPALHFVRYGLPYENQTLLPFHKVSMIAPSLLCLRIKQGDVNCVARIPLF